MSINLNFFYILIILLNQSDILFTDLLINKNLDSQTKISEKKFFKARDVQTDPCKTAKSLSVVIYSEKEKALGSGFLLKTYNKQKKYRNYILQDYEFSNINHNNSKNSSHYMVVTNDHVVQTGSNYKVRVSNKGEFINASVISARQLSSSIDLALLKLQNVEMGNYEFAIFSDSLELGDRVVAGGYKIPKNSNKEYEWQCRTAKVSYFSNKKFFKDGYSIAFTSPLTPGMSGGPLLNHKGELLGVNGKTLNPLGQQDQYGNPIIQFNPNLPLLGLAISNNTLIKFVKNILPSSTKIARLETELNQLEEELIREQIRAINSKTTLENTKLIVDIIRNTVIIILLVLIYFTYKNNPNLIQQKRRVYSEESKSIKIYEHWIKKIREYKEKFEENENNSKLIKLNKDTLEKDGEYKNNQIFKYLMNLIRKKLDSEQIDDLIVFIKMSKKLDSEQIDDLIVFIKMSKELDSKQIDDLFVFIKMSRKLDSEQIDDLFAFIKMSDEDFKTWEGFSEENCNNQSEKVEDVK